MKRIIVLLISSTILLTSMFASNVYAEVDLAKEHKHEESGGQVADMPTAGGVDITKTTANITGGESLILGGYQPLEAAMIYLDYVKTGTITLQEDVTLTNNINLYHCFSSYNYGTKVPTQMLIIDLNNKILNLSAYYLSVGKNPSYKNPRHGNTDELQNSNIIYIKNGTINGTGEKLIEVTGRDTKLFLENVNLVNGNSSNTSTVISSDSGETRFINSKIKSEGYGFFGSMIKTDYFNITANGGAGRNLDCISRPVIEGNVIINTKYDCIHYESGNYSQENDKQLDHLDGTIKLNQGSELNSTNGYAAYFDAYSPTNSYGISIFDTKVNSYDGFYLKNGKLLLSDSFVSLSKDENNVVISENQDSSNIGMIDLVSNKFKNINKIINTTSNSLSNGFIYKDNIAVVKTNNDPFNTDISYGVIDNVIFSKDIQDNKYNSYPLKKTTMTLADYIKDYDQDNILGVTGDLYKISTTYKKIKNIDDFKEALNLNSQKEIYFDETVGTIDFNDEQITINRPVSIFLNGTTINNVIINNTTLNGVITFNNGKLVNNETILKNSGNIQLGDMEIVNNGSDCYAIENSIVKNGDMLNQLIMFDSRVISNNGYGLKFNSNTANSGAHVWLALNNSKVSAKKNAIYSNDIIFDLDLNDGSTINTSNGDAVVSEQTKFNNCNHITIKGNVTAQNGNAIVSNECYSMVGIYNGVVSGDNAIKAKLLENSDDEGIKTFRIDVYGGTLIGKNDTIVTNVDKSGNSNSNGLLSVKAGKFKAGNNKKIISTDLSITEIVDTLYKEIKGGWYSFTETQANEFGSNYDGNGSNGTYKLIKAKNTGDYKYTMARILGVDGNGHTVYDTNGLNIEVNINAIQLGKEATDADANLLMSLTPLEDSAIKEEFDSKLNEGDKYFAYYDFDLISLNESRSNITETSNYQVLKLKAEGISRDINENSNLTIVHKHNNLEPKELVKINKGISETEEAYLTRIENDNIDSCYYLEKESNVLYICVVTRKFSTFAFLEGEIKQNITPPSEDHDRYVIPKTGIEG